MFEFALNFLTHPKILKSYKKNVFKGFLGFFATLPKILRFGGGNSGGVRIMISSTTTQSSGDKPGF